MLDYQRVMLVPSFISLGLICESGPEECYSPLLSLLEGMWARGPGFAVVNVGTRDRGDRGTVGCCLGLQMGLYTLCTVCAAGQEKMRRLPGLGCQEQADTSRQHGF